MRHHASVRTGAAGRSPTRATAVLSAGLTVLLTVLLSAVVGCSAAGPTPDRSGSDPLPPPTAAPPTVTSTSSPADPEPAATPAPTPQLGERCARLVARLEPAQQIGQLFMAGISTSGATAADERVLRRSDVGSVLVLGNSTAGRDAIVAVTDAARNAAGTQRGIRPLLAADQEGGEVQRLRGDGFARIPSAAEQADRSVAELTSDAARWGRQLAAAGIDVNLAPVADVVPRELRDTNAPIGRLDRGYGSDPGRVADHVVAFVRGMAAAGRATSVKHFPGLGQVRGNTDFEADVVDRVTRRDDPGLAGFRAAVDAGVDMVMVASARYRRIDPDHRAAYSPVVMEMIRKDLGFGGVVISDDLAAAAFADVDPDERALRFFRAGGDLADRRQLRHSYPGWSRPWPPRREDDDRFAAEIAAKATRVVTLKARRGLAVC